MLTFRNIVQDDFKKINQWWKEWEFAQIPQSALPKSGYIVDKDGESIAAVWLYKGDTIVCWMEWFISDKSKSTEDRSEALDYLITNVIKEAGSNKLIFSSVSNKSLASRLEKLGFQKGDSNMTNYVRGTNGS